MPKPTKPSAVTSQGSTVTPTISTNPTPTQVAEAIRRQPAKIGRITTGTLQPVGKQDDGNSVRTTSASNDFI